MSNSRGRPAAHNSEGSRKRSFKYATASTFAIANRKTKLRLAKETNSQPAKDPSTPQIATESSVDGVDDIQMLEALEYQEFMTANFAHGGDLGTLQRANPIPEFDRRIEFYEYLVIDERTEKRVATFPIDADTGEMAAPLGDHQKRAEHCYFVDGTLQRCSATSWIKSFFNLYQAHEISMRIAHRDRILKDKSYKYHHVGLEQMFKRWLTRMPATSTAKDAECECLCALAQLAEDSEWKRINRDNYKPLSPERLQEFELLYRRTAYDSMRHAWSTNAADAAAKGRVTHRSIELVLNGAFNLADSRFYTPEMHAFVKFYKEQILPRGLKPWRTELSMFYQPEAYGPDSEQPVFLCGQCDGAFIAPDGRIWLYDWKRSKEIEKSAFSRSDVGHGPLEGLPNCSLQKYYTQLSMYRYMLEAETNYRVAYAAIVCVHPNLGGDYQLEQVPDYQDRVRDALALFSPDASAQAARDYAYSTRHAYEDPEPWHLTSANLGG